MKLALTVWDGRISPVFDVCREALVLEIERGSVVKRSRASLDTVQATGKVDRLLALGIETLICGAITEPLQGELTARGLRVIGFIAGEVDDVVDAFLTQRLSAASFIMPGCQRGVRHDD